MKTKFFASMAWVVVAATGLTGCGGGGSGGQPPVTVYAPANGLEAGFARQLRTLEDNGIHVQSYICQGGEGPPVHGSINGSPEMPGYYPVFLLVTTDASAMGILDAVQERVKRGDSSSPLSEFNYLPLENPSSVLQLHYEPFDCSRMWASD